MNEIGLMQGRLLPRIDGRIQAFPWQSWQREFPTAAGLGFDSIEFIFEGPDIEAHPLLTVAGREEIRSLIDSTGVAVSSVCADFFMEEPLFRGSDAERDARGDVLARLTEGAAEVGASAVEIPCVDQSRLSSEAEKAGLLRALEGAYGHAESAGVRLLLETDLPPAEFRELLDRGATPLLGANYDTGNSAASGYDSAEEIRILGDLIGNIHIKDRVFGGTTVPLGTGSADFAATFTALGEIGYSGPFILQTARDDDDVGAARRYHEMVRGWVAEYL